MAYMLFKYAREKYRERQALTTNDTQLTSDITPGQEQKPLTFQKTDVQGQGSPTPQKVDGKHASIADLEQHQTSPSSEYDARVRLEASRRRKYRWKMIGGLLLPNFLAAVDAFIVAPAVPTISSHFNRLSGAFNWIVAAYTLAFTTFVPCSGQIADIYGRHTALQFHMFFILIGSVFAAAAATWPMVLFGRALQGLGAAGIYNLTRIILSDNATLADNSKNNTIFSLINGISYAVGPVIGGYLTSASWRYCFVLPIPIAFVSMILIFFLMRKDLVKGRVAEDMNSSRRTGYIAGLRTFDWPGTLFFILGISLLILGLLWGGSLYRWYSPAVVIPLAFGGALTIVFFIYEYLLGPGRIVGRVFPNQLPMISSSLFRKKDTSLLMAINFATGVSLVSAFYFISYYWQLAEGYSASKAGVQLLYYTPGIGVGVYSAMLFCNLWPRQTYYTLAVGSIVEAIGLGLLTWAVSSRQRALVNGMLALSGVGTGLRFMPVILHAAGVWPNRIPGIQSLLSFMIPLGQTIGISMMGSVFSNKFNEGLRSIPGENMASGPPNLNILNNLPPEIKSDVQDVAAKAVMWAFVAILPFMGISVVAALSLGNVWIGRKAKIGKDGNVVRPEASGHVLYRSFLLSGLTGRATRNREVVEIKRYNNVVETDREKAPDIEHGRQKT